MNRYERTIPPNRKRVIINYNLKTITYFDASGKTVTSFVKLKHLTPKRVKNFYAALGYATVSNVGRKVVVLEKVA